MTASSLDWYTARAAGIVAYILLTCVVLVGTTLAGKAQLPGWPKFAVSSLHRFGSLLVGAFIAIHVLAIALDTYTPFSLTQLLVPFTASYRPIWVALGIVAAELLVALAVANALRQRLPYRFWRRTHYLTFLVWGGATAHAIGAGTDTHSLWLLLLYLVSVASVCAALAWRLLHRRLTTSLRGLAAVAAVAGVVMVIGLAAAPHGTTARHAAAAPPRTLSDAFIGSISQQNGAGGALVSIVGRSTGRSRLQFRLDLVTPDGQTVENTALQLRAGKTGQVCTGSATSFASTGFRGVCRFPGGSSRTLTGTWHVTADRVTGRIALRA